jgi:hypothetical protein
VGKTSPSLLTADLNGLLATTEDDVEAVESSSFLFFKCDVADTDELGL